MVLVVDWRLFFVLCSRCCLMFFVVVVDWFVRSLVVVAVAAVLVIAVGVAARGWCYCGSGYFWQASTFGSMVRSSIEEPARCCINGCMCVCVWTWWASATMSSSPAPIISSSLNEALTARGIDTSEFLLRISTCPQSYLLQLDVTPFNAQGKMVQTRSRQWGVVAHSSVLLVWPQTSKIL